MLTLATVGSRNNIYKLGIEGLSTDEKPIKVYEGMRIPNGSTFTCIDSLQVFLYDQEHDKWLEAEV